ncbi:hypothetical protein diail_7474 [Diaporthe ilicicola]|nr:hypothetical protein diail_7474 [Diaporthe ilicicola]
MDTPYEDVMRSSIYKFVIGPHSKEFSVHGAAISGLSKPLSVLLNGEMREATEARVEWPDVDEKTFVRFTQWAYTGNYVTEDPDIILDQSLIGTASSATETQALPQDNQVSEQPPHSLATFKPTQVQQGSFCKNQASYPGQVTCLRCRKKYSTKMCSCKSAFSDCVFCAGAKTGPRADLISKFLDEDGTIYPSSTSFSARKNTEGCEDYTGVFLCHAKLYVLGDTYDIPLLKQLSLHRLHATLKDFTLYPSRMNDIAILAKYVFENTLPEDKIREMITLYYACMVEDAWKHEGLKSLIDEIPDFAFGLISKMSERLA